MNKINIVMNDLDVKDIMELFLSVTHDYCIDNIRIEHKDSEGIELLVLIQETASYIDKIYGREIKGKYYFARHEWINKELPQIDWYDEFFCKAEVLR